MRQSLGYESKCTGKIVRQAVMVPGVLRYVGASALSSPCQATCSVLWLQKLRSAQRRTYVRGFTVQSLSSYSLPLLSLVYAHKHHPAPHKAFYAFYYFIILFTVHFM